MAPIAIFLGLFGGCFLGVLSNPDRPPLEDPAAARTLFHIAETLHTPDGYLTRQEFGEIFEDFDTNDDGNVTHAEFLTEWRRLELGDAMSAIVLFNRTDTDGDGIITSIPDLDRVFVLFDLDGNNKVSEPEFVIVWTSLST